MRICSLPTLREYTPAAQDIIFAQLSHVGTDFAPFRFFYTKNQSHAPSFLLFREKSRSVRLLVCKRTRDGSQSLSTFHDIAPSAQPKSPAATAFVGKSCKNTRTSRSKVRFVPTYFFTKISRSPTSLLLLFRKKARLLRLCPCKRGHNTSAALAAFLRYCALRAHENP